MAFLQAREHSEHGEISVATGCYFRACRLIENEPESSEHGLLAWFSAMANFLITSDIDAARDDLKTVRAIAARLHDSNLEALGLVGEGHVLIAAGDVVEGLNEIDQAAAVAMGGDVELYTTGEVYCSTIFACRNVGDWQHARPRGPTRRLGGRSASTCRDFPACASFTALKSCGYAARSRKPRTTPRKPSEELVTATPRYAGWAYRTSSARCAGVGATTTALATRSSAHSSTGSIPNRGSRSSRSTPAIHAGALQAIEPRTRKTPHHSFGSRGLCSSRPQSPWRSRPATSSMPVARSRS